MLLSVVEENQTMLLWVLQTVTGIESWQQLQSMTMLLLVLETVTVNET